MGWAGEPAATPPPALAEYEAKRQAAGNDAAAHVRLALWCELNGLRPERDRQLTRAVRLDPDNALARGLLGMVNFQGRWRRAEAVSEQIQSDAGLSAALAEYNGRRARMTDTAEAHWKLGLWCEENGLQAEALAHYTAVTRLDPSREAAWKRLDCKKVHGRWISAARLAAEKSESASQKRADKHWRPILLRHRSALAGKDGAKSAAAAAALQEIADPRAVPQVWAVFGQGNAVSQGKAVEILGRIDGVPASRALAMLAVFSPAPEVRRAAVETLRHRDPREVMDWLISLIRKPVKYEIRPGTNPGSPGSLFVEGERFNVARNYAPAGLPFIPFQPGDRLMFDTSGMPVVAYNPAQFPANGANQTMYVTASLSSTGGLPAVTGGVVGQVLAKTLDNLRRPTGAAPAAPNFRVPMIIAPSQADVAAFENDLAVLKRYAAANAQAAQAHFNNDVAMLDRYNADVEQFNDGLRLSLKELSGQDLGADANAWKSWWADQQGYAYRPPPEYAKPTIVQDLGSVLYGSPVGVLDPTPVRHSCFRAGTPVKTLLGPRPIESIAIGDRLLVEDATTGELSYEPVLAIHHNPPAKLVKLEVGGEAVWATGIHRFWKAGQGWVMARDLKPGDMLRTLQGARGLGNVEDGPVEPVFNLEVASGQSFFVGRSGILAHDNSLVTPVSQPFDSAEVSHGD